MKNSIKKIGRVASWLIVLIIATLFIRTLVDNWENIKHLGLRPDAFIILALLCFVASIVASGIGWGHIVDRLTGRQVPYTDSIRIHLASWLLKYIPGQAGSLLNKLAWAKKEGLDGKKITASFIYENMFLLIASVVATVPILLVALSERFTQDMSLFVPLFIALPLVILVMTPKFFSFVLNQLFRLLKKKKLSHDDLLTGRDNMRFILEFIIPRIANGAAFVLIAVSLLSIPPSQYIVFGAIYVLAGIVGLLAIFVPSGLGVREAVIVLFVGAYIPVEQAVALALVSRFYATIADAVVALLYVMLSNRKGVKT